MRPHQALMPCWPTYRRGPGSGAGREYASLNGRTKRRAHSACFEPGQTLYAAHALALVAEQIELAVVSKRRKIRLFERNARSMEIDLAPNATNAANAVTQCVVDLDRVMPALAIVVVHMPPPGIFVEGAADARATRRFGVAVTAEPVKAILTVHPLLDQGKSLHLQGSKLGLALINSSQLIPIQVSTTG